MFKTLLLILFTLSNSYATKSEFEFNNINKYFEVNFNEAVIKTGCRTFEVMGHYDLNYFAASAERDTKDESCLISILAGYYLTQNLGESIHLMVLCHELGHFLANGPKKIDEFGKERWSCVEGEADYYATNLCYKNILHISSELRARLTNSLAKNNAVSKICEDLEIKDRDICELSILSSYHKIVLEQFWVIPPYSKWNVLNVEDALKNPSQEIATQINRGSKDYPSDQCRFDTMVAGALNKSRPKCWFKND